MKKAAISPDPQYFSRYIDKVPDIDLIPALEQSLHELQTMDTAPLEAKADYAYGPDKWTIKQVLQHLTDTERIFTYRTLLFARKDSNVAPGFDENYYAAIAEVADRSFGEVLDELKAQRMATIALFKSFSDEVLLRKGMSWKYEMSVLAMGFTTAGHQIHHFEVIRERYL
ncbi:DinB family protein [Chitinophaga sp. Mgbs1]|uniref:DinB family protein n=1 Tax=Chitinophaga solisilvae TaxID=1233460 RepID=A0A433WMS6_9BACT|nr:DinB family protein [Chitinophaga solisilvae]